MEQELMRIGVSLPDNLLGRFDEIIAKRGYSSRGGSITSWAVPVSTIFPAFITAIRSAIFRVSVRSCEM